MSWKKIPINKVFNFEKGILQSSKNTQGEYDFITASSEWKTHSTYSHECEALVFAMAASGSLGRTHYVDGKFIASDLCFIITPKDEYKNKVNLKFYYRYFNAIREIIVKALATGSAKLSINAGNFGKYEIIIGEIEEQNKLIEKLDFIISKRTEISEYIERNIQLSKNLKSSILQDAIQGKLVPQDPHDESASILIEKIQAEKSKLIAEGKLKKQKPLAPIKSEEIPYELPKEWEWVKLGEVLSYLQRGPSAKYSEKSKIGIINQKCIQWRGIELDHIKYYSNELIEKLNEDRYLGEDDILLNSTGTGTIGRCMLLDKLPLKSYIADSHVTVLRSFISQKYVLTFLSSQGIQDFFNNGGVYGTTNQIELSSSTIQNFYFPLPPLQEQNRIVEKIDELIKSCELLDKQVKQAKDRSEKLMESALQGVFNS